MCKKEKKIKIKKKIESGFFCELNEHQQTFFFLIENPKKKKHKIVF